MSEWRQPDWNEWLNPRDETACSRQAGAAAIEDYTVLRNIEWQSRAAPPSGYENRLADALERILGEGAHDLADIVAQLNAAGVFPAGEEAWTQESFCAELKRLSA